MGLHNNISQRGNIIRWGNDFSNTAVPATQQNQTRSNPIQNRLSILLLLSLL